MSIVEMNPWDKKLYAACHVRLPFFTLLSDAIIYNQDCKEPNTPSWPILGEKQQAASWRELYVPSVKGLWYDHFIREKDFCISIVHGDTFDGTWQAVGGFL